MIITFAGHASIGSHLKIKNTVKEELKLIISGLNHITFYLGGYGEFDTMAAVAVRNAKKNHPGIRSTLVIPYIDRDYDPALYDGSLYPPLETVPRRYAISKRNEWMVANSDVVVTCIQHSWGGAATTLKYAERKKKRIISVI